MKNYKQILENVITAVYGEIPADTKIYSSEEWEKNPKSEYPTNALAYATFEGQLYDDLNGYSEDWHIHDRLVMLLEKEKLYFEQGNAWNLGLYLIHDSKDLAWLK